MIVPPMAEFSPHDTHVYAMHHVESAQLIAEIYCSNCENK